MKWLYLSKIVAIFKIALGDKNRIILDDELEQRTKMRRSIVASVELKAGTSLKKEDMDVKGLAQVFLLTN